MAIFPALEPTTRQYTFGSFALTEESSPSAGTVRFRHSNIPAAYELTLQYVYLTDTQADLIRNHYGVQAGGFISFTLPPIVWKGHTFTGNIAPVGMRWRYASPPEEEHHQVGRYSVTVNLESDGLIDGNIGSIATSIATNGAGGGSSGMTATVTASMSAGTATGS